MEGGRCVQRLEKEKVASHHNTRPLYCFVVYYVCMCVCMYGHHIWQGMDQPGKVAHPARGQLNRENDHFPVPVRA